MCLLSSVPHPHGTSMITPSALRMDSQQLSTIGVKYQSGWTSDVVSIRFGIPTGLKNRFEIPTLVH